MSLLTFTGDTKASRALLPIVHVIMISYFGTATGSTSPSLPPFATLLRVYRTFIHRSKRLLADSTS